MNLISQLFHYIYDAEYAALEQDEEYREAKDQRDELERTLVTALTRRQRILFHQYRNQQEALTSLELRRLSSRCTLLLEARENPNVSRETSVPL